MSTYQKAKNVEILVDRKNTCNAVIRNTVTKEIKTFSKKAEVEIVDSFNRDSQSSENIPEKYITEVINPLVEAGFLIVSHEFDLPD